MRVTYKPFAAHDEFGRPLPPSRSVLYSTSINGTRLVFSMNPAPQRAPILLYLHGGPGSASIPLTQRYNAALEQRFRFINVDQRGCGLSYYPFRAGEDITIALMLSDVVTFIQRLRKAYPRVPITVLGHSWGSVLGLEIARQYPELIRRFIGVGQVIDMNASHRARSHSASGLMPSRLGKLLGSESALADVLLYVGELGEVGIAKGLCRDVARSSTFLQSSDYGWRGIKGLLLGSSQSHARLDEELDAVDFSSVRSFDVPVAFVEGRFDRHLPSYLVEQYAQGLSSQHDLVWFEHSAHCPQWEEPSRFAQVVEKLCREK
ncbi:alpha/beta hydrolase [Bombiscardovia apis]|uniref:Alpha/beta hydrolase n=1 Tax=Bombiscardovia apis TaxID=2932182 RepID=A0ABN6SEI2_9BIFI|nr:alpha/beta hydrolase [Bombiscardovia apis]BDR53908.1 alpha/beta hydrolase [Bombiscardovia apis]